MSFNPLAVDQQSTLLSRLVTDVRRLGIDIPKSVDEELSLYRKLSNDPFGVAQALQAAQSALHAAPADKVDTALKSLADATVLAGSAQALTDTVKQIAMQRLQHAVLSQLGAWERQAVDLFNATVDSYELNRWAPDLPDLATLVSPLDLSPQQNNSLQHWRDAAGPLGAIWTVYTRIVQINGDEVGPGGADGQSTNLLLACRLGDPGRFSVAQSAAGIFASIAVGSDAARRYGQLAPFCVSAMCGYELRLSSSEGAEKIRRAIQHAA
jgi:hypothetical protein